MFLNKKFVLIAALFLLPSLTEAQSSNGSLERRQFSNGVEVSSKNLPVVLIEIYGWDRSMSCTGVIFSRDTILTAAHCLEGSVAGISVRVNDSLVEYGASYRLHPQYAPFNTFVSSANDLAYIKLHRKLPKKVKTIALAKREPSSGDEIYVLGFGMNEDRSRSGTLKLSILSYMGREEQNFIAMSTHSGAQICYGDSGGPAMVLSNGKFYLLGTSVYGPTDCYNGISGFTSLLTPDDQSFLKQAKKAKKRSGRGVQLLHSRNFS